MKKCTKLFITIACLCLALLSIPINFDNQIQITSISYEEDDN